VETASPGKQNIYSKRRKGALLSREERAWAKQVEKRTPVGA